MISPELTRLAQEFSSAHTELAYLGQQMDAEIARLKAEFATRYRRAQAKVTDRYAALSQAIQAQPELWVKPRTQVVAGVKIGLAKGKGGIAYADEQTVVARIQKLFGDDEAAAYLHIKVTPDKEAIEKLTACQIAKLGCELVNTQDRVVISPVGGEMSTLARQLLKTLAEEAQP